MVTPIKNKSSSSYLEESEKENDSENDDGAILVTGRGGAKFDPLRGLAFSTNDAVVAGVLFLCDEERIVRICASKDVLKEARRSRRRDWNNFVFLEVEDERKRKLVAAAYIDLLRPRGNRTYPVPTKKTEKGVFLKGDREWLLPEWVLRRFVRCDRYMFRVPRQPSARWKPPSARRKFARFKEMDSAEQLTEMLHRGLSSRQVAEYVHGMGECSDLTRGSLETMLRRYRRYTFVMLTELTGWSEWRPRIF